MKLTLTQASEVIGKTPDEVLYMVQDGRLAASNEPDNELVYLADGRVEFNEPSDPAWVFDFDEVLRAKKELDEGLDGQIRTLLEG